MKKPWQGRRKRGKEGTGGKIVETGEGGRKEGEMEGREGRKEN